MLYVIAIFLPPLALLLAGKLGHALLSLLLVCISIPLMFVGIGFLIHLAPVIHAFVVIGGRNADKRTDRIVRAVQGERR
jgi:hypothetical protein